MMNHLHKIIAAALVAGTCLTGCPAEEEAPGSLDAGNGEQQLSLAEIGELREAIALLQEDSIAVQEELATLQARVDAGPTITARSSEYDVDNPDDYIAPGEQRIIKVFCEEGEVAIGGGAQFYSSTGRQGMQGTWPINKYGLGVEQTNPQDDDPAVGWASDLQNENLSSQKLPVAYVICFAP